MKKYIISLTQKISIFLCEKSGKKKLKYLNLFFIQKYV
jgi:hypothetical protein